MQNEQNGMTIKDVILNQHRQITQLTERLNDLEKKMAVIEQKATVCDTNSATAEETLKVHGKALDFLKGMGSLTLTIMGILIPVILYAGQSWVQLAIVQHEKETVHYKDYLKYPGHVPPTK